METEAPLFRFTLEEDRSQDQCHRCPSGRPCCANKEKKGESPQIRQRQLSYLTSGKLT